MRKYVLDNTMSDLVDHHTHRGVRYPNMIEDSKSEDMSSREPCTSLAKMLAALQHGDHVEVDHPCLHWVLILMKDTTTSSTINKGTTLPTTCRLIISNTMDTHQHDTVDTPVMMLVSQEDINAGTFTTTVTASACCWLCLPTVIACLTVNATFVPRW